MKHPAHGMTRTQKAAFERITIGEDSGVGKRTAEALIARGLIVASDELVRGESNGWPPIYVKRYRVPLLVHIAWCEWCAKYAKEDA